MKSVLLVKINLLVKTKRKLENIWLHTALKAGVLKTPKKIGKYLRSRQPNNDLLFYLYIFSSPKRNIHGTKSIVQYWPQIRKIQPFQKWINAVQILFRDFRLSTFCIVQRLQWRIKISCSTAHRIQCVAVFQMKVIC